MKLSTKIKNTLSTSSPLMKKILDKMVYRKNRARYEKVAGLPVDDKLVLFMSFMGRKYADSPRAIYEYMLDAPEYEDYKFVWAFGYPEEFEFMKGKPRTIVVKRNSEAHYKYYATAKYWVTNSRVPDVISKKDEQVYIQCWHGTPLKKLGLDVEVKGDNTKHSRDEMGNIYRVDGKKYSYMVSPSPYCTEKFISAFGLDEIGREDIVVETGYPRNDDLKNFDDAKVTEIKQRLGIPLDKKVILYAPTWRDNQYSATVGYTYDGNIDFGRFQEELSDEYVVLFRTHYFVSNAFDFEAYEGFIFDVSTYNEINDLYIISDLLITDYSSVFFDYANLRRPMVFYMYDLAEYRDELRGFYISLDELPGPIVETQDKLTAAIKASADWKPDDKYDAFNAKFNPLDDGKASQRVANMLIK